MGFICFSEVLAESHEKYGSVVKLWLGPTKLLVSIKEPALIKEMLSKAEDKPPLTGRAFRLAFGQSSLFASTFDRVPFVFCFLNKRINDQFLLYYNVVDSAYCGCMLFTECVLYELLL